jgi:hypothetical protein
MAEDPEMWKLQERAVGVAVANACVGAPCPPAGAGRFRDSGRDARATPRRQPQLSLLWVDHKPDITRKDIPLRDPSN